MDQFSDERENLELIFDEIAAELNLPEKRIDKRKAKFRSAVYRLVHNRNQLDCKPFDLPRFWPRDSISEYIDFGFRNAFASVGLIEAKFESLVVYDAQFRVTILNLKEHIIPKLQAQRDDGTIFEDLVLRNDDWLEIFFLMRSHAAWLSSVNLCLTGSIPEMHMTLRGSVENALYAYRIFRTPKVKKHWFRRDHIDENVRKKVSLCFSINEIGIDMLRHDPELNEESKSLYEELIIRGGHPNIATFWDTTIQTNENNTVKLNVNYQDPKLSISNIDTLKRVARFNLRIFDLIFPLYSAFFEIP